MSLSRPRLYGVLLALAAVTGLLTLHATVAAPVVYAMPCCEECEGIQNAGYEACDRAYESHTEACGGLSGCYADVDQLAYPCWSYCQSDCQWGCSPADETWCDVLSDPELNPHGIFCANNC